MLKHTPLHTIHRELGARLVPFAGWEMPVQYKGILEEHLTVRDAVGLFDVSHMGQIELSGGAALEGIQYITTNDASRLYPGRVQYTALCNEEGGVIDDVTLYMLDKERYLFCVNASNTEKDLLWIREQIGNKVNVSDRSRDYALIAIQGPLSVEVAKRIWGNRIEGLRYYHFTTLEQGGSTTIISRTGYTGEDGFEVYIDSKKAVSIWQRLMDAGRDLDIMPCGLGARDTLRIEMKYCLYGNELTEETTPLEAGLGWIVKFDKGEFVGRDALLRQKEKGVDKRLIGFEMLEGGIPRHGYSILSGDRVIGTVTSGTFSPSLKKPIGIGYILQGLSNTGMELLIDIRGKIRKAVIVETPFVKGDERHSCQISYR